jgi:ABC-type nitrate/sulfonate/bicarbonate transport system substrate-binding protein
LADLVKLRVNVFNVDAALSVGRGRGLFAASGLDVDVEVTPNSTDQMRGLGEGAWEIVSTAFDNVLGWSGREGAEIVAVAQVAQGLVLPIYVRTEIHDWKDLKGKRLAVDAVDTAYALVLRRMLLAHGLDLKRGDYELVPAGATGHRLESMNRGETFAGILNAPWDGKAAVAGHRRLADHREVLPNYPGGVFAVARKWATDHGGLLLKFLRVWKDALRWTHDGRNRNEALKLVAADQSIDEKAAAARLSQLHPDGQLNIDGLQTVLELRTSVGLTPPMGEDLKRYYDSSYYREAQKGL